MPTGIDTARGGLTRDRLLDNCLGREDVLLTAFDLALGIIAIDAMTAGQMPPPPARLLASHGH